MRCHVSTEVEEHLVVQTTCELREATVVDNHSAERRCAPRQILRRRHHFDVHALLMRTELRERYRRRVSHKRNVVRVRYLSQSREISHLQLWVCYYFEKDAAGVSIHSSAHFVEVRKVAQMRRHAEAWQRLCQQRVGVAEHVS